MSRGVVRCCCRSWRASHSPWRSSKLAPRQASACYLIYTVTITADNGSDPKEFAHSVTSLCDVWISNEAPQLFPEIAARAGTPGPRGQFLLAVNSVPVAWADPHGASLDWIT